MRAQQVLSFSFWNLQFCRSQLLKLAFLPVARTKFMNWNWNLRFCWSNIQKHTTLSDAQTKFQKKLNFLNKSSKIFKMDIIWKPSLTKIRICKWNLIWTLVQIYERLKIESQKKKGAAFPRAAAPTCYKSPPRILAGFYMKEGFIGLTQIFLCFFLNYITK